MNKQLLNDRCAKTSVWLKKKKNGKLSPIYLTTFNKYTKIIEISFNGSYYYYLFKHGSKYIQKSKKLILRMCVRTITN